MAIRSFASGLKEKPKATIKVTATDAAGNSATDSVRVTLTKKKP